MDHKDFKVTRVVKVAWDEMWHVHYVKFGKETYDRVSKEEAIEIGENMEG